ncbi:MAG TPA: NAD(P)/FAD-dependent oxidoreductase [Desulfobulbaceae bacterium]|nr:NAD(P)/FAD-dependent oxidoreductase [Desulfobulbaceae bacterium]
MKTSAEIIIIGAGPGGLACAKKLAENGRDVLVLERKDRIGPKICAGGITWNGLLCHVPEELLERTFYDQYIFSNLQHIRLREKKPMVATINRKNLGRWMARAAKHAGATLTIGSTVKKITNRNILVKGPDGNVHDISYRYLIGADGATSMVRRFLGIPTKKMGIGINYIIDEQYQKMEWHLNSKLFGSGYGWIFPHRQTLSIGAFTDQRNLSAAVLKKRLLTWAKTRGYDLSGKKAAAALVNSDFQGCFFNNIYLIGDAAGLASGLTGEGIYPAIISGEAVAKKIIDPAYPADEIFAMKKKQQQHYKVIQLAAKYPLLSSLLMEWLVVLLRIKILDFHILEMAE